MKEPENKINMEDYADCPFAMETVNGEILSFSSGYQRTVLKKLARRLKTSMKGLAAWMAGEEDLEPTETIDPEALDTDVLSEVFGLDAERGTFSCEEIGFLESPYGFEIKELLEMLDVETEFDGEDAGRCIGEAGVWYIPQK